jgi:hypothetical protein
MMKKIKGFLAVGAVVGILSSSIFSNGMTLQYIGMGSGLNVYIEGYNAKGAKGTGAYGTNRSKVVTGCSVRLREGNYNKTANNYAQKGGWTARLSKVNNPFNTAYTTYSWRY